MAETDLARARETLRQARRIFVLTGAGISAESGVPTFRGGGGSTVWRGMPFEVLSSAKMVEEDLPLVWEWFDYRRGKLSDCEPNAGHAALADAAASGRFETFSLVTQNIDGLHRRAGSSGVIELHGDIGQARCLSCAHLRNLGDIPADERPPVCTRCADSMRPNVVLFGEMLDPANINAAIEAADNCDLCFVVGTSALVFPANELPKFARRNGAAVIEINPEETILTSHCDLSIRSAASTALPAIFEEFSDRD